MVARDRMKTGHGCKSIELCSDWTRWSNVS